MSRAVLMPRTAAKPIIGAIFIVLILTVVIMLLNGFYQSSTQTSADTRSKEAMKNTQNNVILGTAILGILGTFGTIAYYYRTISFDSKK